MIEYNDFQLTHKEHKYLNRIDIYLGRTSVLDYLKEVRENYAKYRASTQGSATFKYSNFVEACKRGNEKYEDMETHSRMKNGKVNKGETE